MQQTPQSALALALFAGCLLGPLAGLIGLDAVAYATLGRTATVSHGMYVAGVNHPWLRHLWTGAGLALVVGLRLHFWGRRW